MKEGKKGILRAIPMFLCVGAACCALQSFYRVSEQEQAVVTLVPSGSSCCIMYGLPA